MIRRPLFGLSAGLLGLHLLLWTASALGRSWTRPAVAALWLGFGVLLATCLAPACRSTWRSIRRSFEDRGGQHAWLGPTAICLGLAAFGALTLASWQGWSVHPDWAFHWGPKALRFALAEGIDLEYLSRPWNLHVHPDYPTLLPNLTASLALALGQPVTPRIGAVVTLLFAALWFISLRSLAWRLGGSRWSREAAWLTAVWCATMFATGFRQAAGADLPFACAVTLGALALAATDDELRHRSVEPDLVVGFAAALACQVKFEGSIFALVLVVLWVVRRLRAAEPRRRAHALARTLYGAALLPCGVLAIWIAWNHHHGLFLASNTGTLELGRLTTIASGLWRAATERAWHGVPYALAVLPWLCLHRRTRWPALLLAAQFAAYVGVYLTTPTDLDLLLLTSAPRLLFHLLPTFLVLLIVALGDDDRGQSAPDADVRDADVADAWSSDSPSAEAVNPSFLA